jgi:predicted ArsR family transcriptional regulator
MSDASAAKGDGPFEEQRQIYELLSQETRHLILQFILGHPKHLPSLDELAYMMPKNKAAIRDQLAVLSDAGIIDCYRHPPNEAARDLPSQFYGPTEHGVTVLSEYNYLRGLPVARALYDNTRCSEKARRHREAPRPDLPHSVEDALRIDQDGSVEFDRLEQYVREQNGNARSVDDQITVAKAFYNAGIGPEAAGIKRTALLDEVDVDIEYQPGTILNHLVDAGVLAQTAPAGPDVFAISERLDEIVNGQVTAEAEANLESLIAHIDDELQVTALAADAVEQNEPQTGASAPSVAVADGAGRTIRSILATAFDIEPEQVTDVLRSGDPVDRLNTAVEAIESSDEVTKSEEYGQIVFVRPAYRYRLTERAMNLVGENARSV